MSRPSAEELERIREFADRHDVIRDYTVDSVKLGASKLLAEIDAQRQEIERLEKVLKEWVLPDSQSEALAEIETLKLHQREDDKDRDILKDRLATAVEALEVYFTAATGQRSWTLEEYAAAQAKALKILELFSSPDRR